MIVILQTRAPRALPYSYELWPPKIMHNSKQQMDTHNDTS